ncbi:acyl-CoA-binding domain-containing protein 3-like [Hibiscus syriacus]|uniref:acyl-CoA-binding domain-containing protein 3-like n=1 Tax=Hibiscus syriacus TaxID=106335 RepID=UPI001920D63A|nr:acyl-CoA-binding domain-containing protein 3-like [Hibiscus syriacus]
MEIFLELLFTVSFSFIISFILAKLLSFSSAIDQHLEILSRSYVEVTAESEKHVFECENGIGFDSEAVKVYAFGESMEEIDTREESLNGSEGTREVKEGTTEGEENFVSETTEIGLANEDEEEIEVWDCEKENGKGYLMEGLSDDDWEGIERTELEKKFGKAVCFLECKSNANKDFKLGDDLKKWLYGLHKIATEGPCYEPQPMTLEFSARAKWNAWKRLGNMSPEAAMELYITLVSSSIPGFVQEDIHGDDKQDCADAKTSSEQPSDVKSMADNQPTHVDYRTSKELTADVQNSDRIKSSSYTP